MLKNEFEDIIIQETPYYKNLEKRYRDTINFRRYYWVLKRICPQDNFVKYLEGKKGKELVYLGRKIFSLQEEFVSNYLTFLDDETQVTRWEKFFERYNKTLFEIYERFVGRHSERVMIFEIVNRKLLRDLLTKYIMDKNVDKKIVISERFGKVVNQLFAYIRHSLAKFTPIHDGLISDSYEQLPLLPKCGHNETLKLLANKFLGKGLPEPIFSAIYRNIISLYYTRGKKEILDSIAKNRTLDKKGLIEIFNSYFFFPDDQALSEILEALKNQARAMVGDIKLRREKIEHKMLSIRSKIKDITSSLADNLVHLTEDFSTEESIENMIKRLKRSLVSQGYDLKILKGEYQVYLEQENSLNAILNFKLNDLTKFITRNEWDPLIILLFEPKKKFDEEPIQTVIKNVMGEIKNNQSAMRVMANYKVGGFLKEKYNINMINEKFYEIVQDVIEPFVKALLLEEMIDYYPKLSGVVSSEGIRYLGEEVLAERALVVEKDIRVQPKRTGEEVRLNISRYKNLVSILVYDIRGSTFMGTKLRDAKKESEIRNLFQESMLSAAEKYGGIPIKDTGDGGIILFAANHYDIKNNKTLVPEPGNVLSVVRSSLQMVKDAETFVEENIHKYKYWFRDAEERKINFEGITYATLPPSYKTIFQIGVGIASGQYPKEVYLDKNAFGEFDVTGMLVREANFYSKIKAKGRSTIVCDDATVYNVLLNVDKFSFLSESGLRIDPMLLDTEQGLEYWINQKVSRKGFILDLYKIFVSDFGQEIKHPGSIKILVGVNDIVIDETGEIKDGKGGRGKFLFEISTELGR